uniref:Uncharacterized protein n=1 Tax=Kryptolebias marmoratus TaxID=37003 RepID=A0A3Q2ZT02_KRYMA
LPAGPEAGRPAASDDLCCPICRDIYSDPVILSCSHSYCKRCLHDWWDGKTLLECPVCKKRLRTKNPPCNLPESFCSLHAERFEFFCEDHQEPVCLICKLSDAHSGHKFRPIDAGQLKTELRKLLRPLQEKLKLLSAVKEDCEGTAKHNEIQAQQAEGCIKEQFKRLYRFLHKEEELRINALREEKRKKSQLLREKIDAVSRQIAVLSNTIQDTEEIIKLEDASFLLDFGSASNKLQHHPLPDNPQPPSGALIDVAKHLGNLTFNIWTKMKHLVSYTPVVLDPNSANEELIVSSDLTTVRCGQKQNVPDNPERFDCFRIVLGSEGFHSDSHSWDVDVGDSTDWFVGVASESVRRKGKHPSSLWRIGCVDGKYIARSQSDPSTALSPIKKLQKIRVYLDCSRGKLLFFDLDTNTHLHTFTHTFTEKLFPYFNTVSLSPMKLTLKGTE